MRVFGWQTLMRNESEGASGTEVGNLGSSRVALSTDRHL